jgi:hypothetical protein
LGDRPVSHGVLPGDWALGKVCIDDPLAAVWAVTTLTEKLLEFGYTFEAGSSLSAFNAEKLQTREKPVTPFFGEKLSGLNTERFFWMKILSREREVVGLQGYRCDYVDTNLSEWAPTYVIGLYMRNGEIFVPSAVSSSKPTLANGIRGKLVYHGEFWVASKVRNWKVAETFSRLGMILSLIKWNPDAVWALSDKDMATRGHPGRMGYNYLESGFLRWQWTSEDNPQIEWLHLSERAAIEKMIAEMKIDWSESNDLQAAPQRPASNQPKAELKAAKLSEYQLEQSPLPR